MHSEMKDVKAEKDIKSPTTTDMLPPSSTHIETHSEPQSHEFKLAPTPAQLGKAPLQRRQSMGKSCLYSVWFESNTAVSAVFGSNNPQLGQDNSPLPTPTTLSDDNPNELLVSPLTKKSFFKRNIEDGMDR